LKRFKTYFSTHNRKKMYCKVCFDAGKPEEEVKSHYPKNQFGMVVCPTLLSQNCLRCGYLGHTSAYCINIPITTQRMFCPFCQKRGADVEEYTDHNMWSNGAIVCEYLLNCECQNCGEMGHTPKYCPKPKKKYCPACDQRGASDEEYTNHNLFEDGVVVCEFILACECRNCGELGHTPKYCQQPRRKSTAEKLREGQNLSAQIDLSLKNAGELPQKKRGKRTFVRVL